MTYFQFHLVFTLPVIAGLFWALRRTVCASKKQFFGGLLFLAALALVYTTPWDNYLVYKKVWDYPPERVLFTIGYVPFEEYLFFILQTVMTSLWTFFLFKRSTKDHLGEPRKVMPRALGVIACLLVALGGAYALTITSTFYMGLILAWAFPVAAIHWGYGGDWLWRDRWLWLKAVSVPTLYLVWADRLAIGMGIWSISEEYTTGMMLGGLPIEEAIFFMVANILVVQGTLTYWITWEGLRAQKMDLPSALKWLFPKFISN